MNPASYTVKSITSTAVASDMLGKQNGNYIGTSNVGPFGFNNTPLTYPLADGSVNGSLVQRWNSSQIALGFAYEGVGADGQYTSVPDGLNENNLFGTDTVRNVSNKGPFEGNSLHPIIVRSYGTNFDEPLGNTVHLDFLSPQRIYLVLKQIYIKIWQLYNTLDYKSGLKAIAGIVWLELQQRLQGLNPTLETTEFQSRSVIGNQLNCYMLTYQDILILILQIDTKVL